ncbi:DNA polymerase-3 subunit epsilon [Desulfuromusa kysingii]|uniref:DNA polymerase-3 subunit epsilon n=1 Tax=Desulfuromusa kysingii TaxID=37625 RepID=A0A1H3Y4U7_9BACT|nr:3'-5' exonuclease [Desulfuromusa kysingii]SEA06685.1 DNA polymerase-3 subunit epsilon [Desulfuromusa kysingii]
MPTTYPTEPLIVLDFETTGLYPAKGDRIIEIGAVLIREESIVDRFQSLVNPGFLVSREIETITGISNTMLSEAPPAAEVMASFLKFLDTRPLVAHNASFDKSFLEAELDLLDKKRPLNFGCTLQVARRLYPDVINYKLETLIRYKEIPVNSQFHRALADAEMTAKLLVKIIADLKSQFGFESIPFDLLKKIGKMNKELAFDLLLKEAEESRNNQIGMTGNLFG